MFSLSQSNRYFYLVLLGVFLFHAGFMAVKIRDHFTEVKPPLPGPLTVKLVQEALKEVTHQHKQQIVQSEDAPSDMKPVEAAFLSDKDRSFDRQTVAAKIDTFKKAAVGNSTVTQKAEKPQPSARKNTSLKNLKLSDVGIASGDPVPQPVERIPASVSQEGLNNGDPLADGFSATNDYVQEMALGDFTHLNTVEYKFYGFFHRIRQKLEQFWGKSIHEKSQALFRSGRRMPANQDLVTSLQVTLNDQGEIIGVKILGASGVRELDEAAIESFNMAGPFPNPPKELLVNGKAVIEWGFVVKS